MGRYAHCIASSVLLTMALATAAARAENHAAEALKHAAEAADSGDSKSIGEHATEALKHIEAAKEAPDSGDDDHLKHGEADLNSAVQHSRWYNTDRAAHEAADGKAHLEAVGK